ncbi:hypothetical protein DERF_001218 [Dermatophagoides farinae]|uniref:Uncharacterized protein n=1 Tax=Dermatophagoides farinae TaxID=6954 RepID=A0A922I863_DERFA|nr:hypothetical protein DERF_001218 [Dermatophagoides farinae]
MIQQHQKKQQNTLPYNAQIGNLLTFGHCHCK